MQRLQLCDDSKFARVMSCAFELEVNKIIRELSADDADDSHNLDGPGPDPTSRRLDDRYESDLSYTWKMARARTVARRILEADNTKTIEKFVLAGYKKLSSPWRALVQRVPDHTAITAPFLSLTLEKAGGAGMAGESGESGESDRSAGEEELQSSSAALGLTGLYIKLAQRAHPFTKLRRELKALRRSAQETERSTEQEQEHSDQESAEARAPPFEHASPAQWPLLFGGAA